MPQFLLDDIADKLVTIVMEDHGSGTQGDNQQSRGQGMGRDVLVGEVRGLWGVHTQTKHKQMVAGDIYWKINISIPKNML